MCRPIALLIVAAFLVAGCGAASDDPPAAQGAPTTAAAPATATTSTPAAPRAPTPSDIATAKAICAQSFYAQAFDSLAQCEAEMSDPKAVAELRESIENFAKPTP